MIKNIAVLLAVAIAPAVHAADLNLGQALKPDTTAPTVQSWQMAAVETDKTMLNQGASDDASTNYKDRWFTLNKTHQYLGIGSIALASLAVLAPKPAKDEHGSTHQELAEGAAVLGGLAVATGIGFHYDDLKLSRGFKDPDNLHALLATLGAIGFFLAVDEAPDSGHAGVGAISGLAMLTAVKITW